MLDWNKTADVQSSWVLMNLMDGLSEYDFSDPANITTRPQLAESIEVSKDKVTYTYHIRKNVKWHDGVPLVAQHFVDGWRRLLDPATGCAYAYFLYDIKNAKAFNQKKVDFSQVGIQAADPHTLKVTLTHPVPYFNFITTHASTYPVRLDLIQKYGDKWTEAGNMVGVGPFKLTSWVHDSRLTLERNEEYYGEKAKLKTIVWLMILDQSSALSSYETGQADMLFDLPNIEYPRLRREYPNEFKEAGLIASYYLGFNLRKKPFNDVRVRKAFSMAVDRTEVTKVLAGGQIPISSWIPKGVLGFNPDQGVKFNPEEARKLLKEAGYENAQKLPRIIAMYNTNEGHKLVIENVQAQLLKNLGVKIEILNQEWKVYSDKLQHLKKIKNQDENEEAMSIFRMGWNADYPDPDNFMNLFASYSDNNYGDYSSPEFDELVHKGSIEFDNNKRKEIYSKAQSMLTERDVPIMPLYVYTQHMMIKPYIKNYAVNPMQVMRFDKVSVE
jgi:oligopeptide transport system substrate-binding protein